MSLAELQALERDYAIPTYVRNPVEFVRGEGCRLWDADGHEYLDFLAGISVLNVGHCHPRIVETVREQVGRLTHVTNLYYTEPGLRLSARLAQSSLGGKVFLCNSGAERVRTELDSLDGGMRPKLEACLEAIDAGVSAAHILDGRRPHSLLLELFTDAGIGTKIAAQA